MGSFGDRLRKEREQRSISLDDISLSTKIGTRMLRALEEEKFEQLPGGIFNKGFVRAYARHLGLDEEQTIADYLAALGESQAQAAPADLAPAPKPAPVVEHHRPVPIDNAATEKAFEIPWAYLALVLVLLALALASWSYYHRTPPVERTNTPTPNSDVALPSGAAPADQGAHTPAVPSDKPAVPESHKAPTSPIPVTDQPAMQAGAVSQAALHASDSAVPPGMFTVKLKGNDDADESWVSVAVDGQAPFEITLSAPTERMIQAKNEVVVRVGNAGALDAFFNGKKLPPLGDYGVVRTLRFRADGLQAPPPDKTTPAAAQPVAPR
jgi:cytoskeleton protein RodZ